MAFAFERFSEHRIGYTFDFHWPTGGIRLIFVTDLLAGRTALIEFRSIPTQVPGYVVNPNALPPPLPYDPTQGGELPYPPQARLDLLGVWRSEETFDPAG